MIVDKKTENFRDNLLLIRRLLGWSAKSLGDKVGITRQTINSIESGRDRYQLNRTQYLAMRYVIDEEIKKNKKETEMVQGILYAFVDYPEKYSDDDRKQIKKRAEALLPEVVEGTTSKQEAFKKWLVVFGALGVGLVVSGIVVASWKKK